MAKLLHFSLLATALGMATPAFADDVTLFSFTVDDAAVEKNILIKVSAEDGQKINVDWGNGTLVPYDIVDYNAEGWVFSEVKGTLAGKTVTVYGTDASKINYLDLDWDLDDDPAAKITSVDVSNLTGVTELNASKNMLSSLDVSKCVALKTLAATNNVLTKLTFGSDNAALTSVNVSNNYNTNTGEKNEDAGDNQVLGSNWGQLANLATLNVTGNLSSKMGWLGKFDISQNAKISTLNINCCGISSLDFSSLTSLKTLNAQWNKFTAVDLSNMVAKSGVVFLNHNNLKSIKLPDTSASKMTRVNLADNALDFSTLPAAGMTSNAANYVYTPQADIFTPLSGTNTVDFTSQSKVGETASVFAWTAILDGKDEPETLSEEHYEFSEVDGVFKFLVPVRNLQAAITNEALPALTLTSSPATSVGLLPALVSMEMASEAGADFLFAINSNAAQSIYVDWGDGMFDGPIAVDAVDVSYTPSDITGKIKGKSIKVKGDPTSVQSFMANAEASFTSGDGEVTTAQIESIDLGNLTEIQKLNLNNHAVASLDLSKNTKLTDVSVTSNKLTVFNAELPELKKLDLSNAGSNGVKTLGENAPEIDLGKYPALTNFTASYTGIAPDLSKAPKLTTAILQGNGYTDYAPVSATVTTMTLNFNDYETFDGTGLTAIGKVNVFLTYNKLGATAGCVKTPANINNLNISNNSFTFATLPAVKSVGGTLTYAPQKAMEVEAKGNVVDLSAQAIVDDTATVYTWKLGDAEATDGIAAENGVFTFANSGEYVCSMTNALFPKLTLTTAPIIVDATSGVAELEGDDANAPVEYYNLQGVKVSGDAPGVYVRRQGKHVSKVIVK